ncbi:ABC transporter substrate-binding protein [Rhodovarius sp.]|uniref:ABC transporter substrate-binding protein n=1 Tax=Rhodovarius sp. TaxID=2972673 RepID=UPI0034A1EF09
MNRRDLMLGATALAAAGPAAAQGASTLRVAMTVGDIPLTTGQPSQGSEGNRFCGITFYDPLIAWDLSASDRAATLRPSLAESWTVGDDGKTWRFRLRSGVRFHDGSLFNAEAVAWNLGKLLDREAPQFDRQQAAQGSLFTGNIARWRVRDAATVEIETKNADAVFPYIMANVFFSSPARFAEVGNNWERFAERPSGTGPYIVDRVVPRERLEARRNGEYWQESRRPKHERLALLPMPDGLTRVAALLSNQVDFIEAPPPDAVPRLRSAGFQVPTNAYPHIWCHQLSHLPDSPFRDVRVRKAANLAINRDALVQLLGGLALPAKGMVNDNHPWFGRPSFEIKYDPDQARRLLAEAGYSRANPVRTKFIVAPSGSGQMQPMPMNEAIQQDFRAVGIELEFEVMDWEALRARRRASAEGAENRGMHGINNSWGFWDPDIGLLGPAYGRGRVVGGFNWGNFQDGEADDLCEAARRAFDPAEQNRILARLHARMVDQAMWLWVVHDVNPRGLSRRVQGFVQAQAWFQDLTPIRMG